MLAWTMSYENVMLALIVLLDLLLLIVEIMNYLK
jgi:hypothetical protein